jgi:hypothetical protein
MEPLVECIIDEIKGIAYIGTCVVHRIENQTNGKNGDGDVVHKLQQS